MRRGVRFPAWYLPLVAVLGILIGCQSLRDLERFAIRHHAVLTEARKRGALLVLAKVDRLPRDVALISFS